MTELARVSSAWLSDLAREYRVCGAQLAIQHHEQITTAEAGELEYCSGHKVTRDSAFPVGSITKPFTATLAMMLVADGETDLEKPLDSQLPELGGIGGQLTLGQLLSHTAGLACGPDSAELSSSSLRRYAAEHCGEHNVVHPPAAGFSYSNLGYVLVGRLIEVLTDTSWPAAMASLLLEPLGIEPSFIQPAVTGAPARAVATGHSVTANPERTRPVQQSLAAAEAPAGALAVSARDLLELGMLHLPPGSPWLLPPEQARLMREPVPEADPFGLADGWGLGLALFQGEGSNWAGHDGNADGTSCHLRIDPVDGWIIALTTNTNTGTGLWHRVCGELAEAGVPLPVSPQAMPVGSGEQTMPAGPGEQATAARPGEQATSAGPGERTPSSGPGGRATPELRRSLPPECAGTYANGDAEYVVTGPDGDANGHSTGPDGDANGRSTGGHSAPGHSAPGHSAPGHSAQGHSAPGQCTLSFGGTDFRLLASDGDLTFALLEPSSGQCLPGGRFRRDPVTGRITGMQVSGRVARRLEAGEL